MELKEIVKKIYNIIEDKKGDDIAEKRFLHKGDVACKAGKHSHKCKTKRRTDNIENASRDARFVVFLRHIYNIKRIGFIGKTSLFHKPATVDRASA